MTKMNGRIKGEIYKTVLRPVMLYGAETWASKSHRKRKWMWTKSKCCDGPVRDKGDRIKGPIGVTELFKKVQWRRLKWYGLVMRRGEDYVGRDDGDEGRGHEGEGEWKVL